MEDHSADAIVNRDEPVPVFHLSAEDRNDSDDSARREKHSRKLSATTIREKVSDRLSPRRVGDDSSGGVQDKLLSKLLQQIIPTDEANKDYSSDVPGYTSRPAFSLPVMTNNFRRFNSRVGVVFVFQNRLIRLLSWRTPTHTLSFLAVYTLLCLDPYLLAVLPLVILLLFVMVPSFVTRHPPPPTNLSTDSYSAYGPPVAPPPTVKPVSEMSKDFFRNMRDLQNSMEDFAQIHDKVVDLVAPPTNFSNETLSSAVFLFLFVASCILFLASHLLPWRAISLLAGWAGVCAGHPSIQRQLVSTHKDHVQPRERRTQSWVSSWIDGEIKLDSGPEMREVEVFELQRRSTADEWAGWVFSPSPHDPLSPDRVTGHRPRGTRFFEDVQAPPGWEWSDKKWTLDLLSREWVEERMITGVEIEMEGERWVYDISYDDESDETEDGTTIKGKGRRMEWEEGTGLGKTGPWRRRRWVRTVKRKGIGRSSPLIS